MPKFYAHLHKVLPLLLLTIPLLYLVTLARGLVLGDPTEYTMIATILGIAHPPGYAFITILGKLWQTLIPFGDIPWRMHLLSAVGGTAAAACVYGIIKTIGAQKVSGSEQLAVESEQSPLPPLPSPLSQSLNLLIAAALFAAFTLAFSANWWQHAIHANPHIWTAMFLAFNLYCLTKWGAKIHKHSIAVSSSRRVTPSTFWLFLFSFSAGLGLTHHPLTVFAFPAYAIFMVVVRPRILLDWHTWLKMLAFALLGLSLWLYFPLRSPSTPFGPTSMNTLNGFLDHVLARGLSDSLPYFRLVDLPNRLLVFWSILRLQYPLPTIFLALIGVGWLAREGGGERREGDEGEQGKYSPFSPHFSLLILYVLAFLFPFAFVLMLRAQDIMAYLLGPLLVVALLAGIGLYGLLMLARARLRLDNRALALLVGLLMLLGPVSQMVRNGPRLSLRFYDEGHSYVNAVYRWFAGQGEGVTLLNDWEHQTPLWYNEYAFGQTPDPADVRPRLVSAARPWVESVFDFLPGGPVYLSNYRREIVEAGFRLRPRGPFYQVVEPGDTTLPPELTPITGEAAASAAIALVGFDLPQTIVTAGEYIPLTLAMRVPELTSDYYAPVVRVGEMVMAFTTDSHLITPLWQPGEIIVERFDFALPHHLANGVYPVTVALHNLSQNEDAGILVSMGQLQVVAAVNPPRTEHLLANFRQKVGLVAATAKADRRGRAPWNTTLTAQPGDVIHLTLTWECLAHPEQSYTVFVHLIRPDNSPVELVRPLDYTPLGGSAPTHLWIPKWLPGQRYTDPYRLELPPDLPPGRYYIEVGLYEMVSGRRLHLSDSQGNLAGDRYILGAVEVTP